MNAICLSIEFCAPIPNAALADLLVLLAQSTLGAGGYSNGTLRELLTVIVGSHLQSPLQAPSATYDVQGIVTAAIRTA